MAMLSVDQMETLHVKESQLGRCLFPSEVTNLFSLGLINEYWSIPDNTRYSSKHGMRIRDELIRSGCYIDISGDISVINIDNVHIFDQNVIVARDKETIHFEYQGERGSSRKIIDELTVE